MKSRILLLGKETATLDSLAGNLQEFNQELVKVSSESKAIELLSQKLNDLIIIDTSFSLEERKKLLLQINSLNKKASFHLLNRQEEFAVRDMVSFVEFGIQELKGATAGK